MIQSYNVSVSDIVYKDILRKWIKYLQQTESKSHLEKKTFNFFLSYDFLCGCEYLCYVHHFFSSSPTFYQRTDYERDVQDNDCVLHPSSTCSGLIRAVSPAERLPHMTARHKTHCPYHYCHFTVKCPALDSLSLHWVWFPPGESERGTRSEGERGEGIQSDKERGSLWHCHNDSIIISGFEDECKQAN